MTLPFRGAGGASRLRGFYKKFDEIYFNPSVSLRSTPPLQGRQEKLAETNQASPCCKGRGTACGGGDKDKQSKNPTVRCGYRTLRKDL